MLVQSVRVDGKVKHKSVDHLGTLTKWDEGKMGAALAERYDQSIEPVPNEPGFVRARRGRSGSSLRGMDVLHSLGSLDAHDNAERHYSSSPVERGFIYEAAIKIYHHAPVGEHARLIAKLEAFVLAFVGRAVKAPAIDDEPVQTRLRSLARSPEEREAELTDVTERIRTLRGDT